MYIHYQDHAGAPTINQRLVFTGREEVYISVLFLLCVPSSLSGQQQQQCLSKPDKWCNTGQTDGHSSACTIWFETTHLGNGFFFGGILYYFGTLTLIWLIDICAEQRESSGPFS